VATALAIQPNGKIVVVSDVPVSGGPGIGLVRYNPNGTLDPSFSGDGKVLTNVGGISAANALAIQPNRKIVVAGSAFESYLADFALVRYNPDGTLDTTFGEDGVVLTDFGNLERAFAVALQPNRKIVVAGYSILTSPFDCTHFALARYHVNGTLDTSFSGDGKVLTDLGGCQVPVARSVAMVLQPDRKIVVAGISSAHGDEDFALVRYNPDGILDTTFGEDGVVLTDFENGRSNAAFALAIQPRDGRLVVAGRYNRTGYDLALARYHAITCDDVVVTRVGTAGKDTIVGTSGPDVIQGFGGNDLISGLGGSDMLCGGIGKDTLRGGGGNDLVHGGPGKDTCNGGPGKGDQAEDCEQVTNVP
jgi:uncharacterized delta-60 repeat protein